ncbi:MAG TPA: twin-arginine translocation signal domain-containing protein [Anaerolineales bacterium]|nr:twin-arginine translocation signal domain-containing protein [Anaerolineales bacterium]
MTQRLSRRDALKVLGAAAGATALANLPSKWTTPELTAGVLPAHAQSSCNCTDPALNVKLISGSASLVYVGDKSPGDSVEYACDSQKGCIVSYWNGLTACSLEVQTFLDDAPFSVPLAADQHWGILLDVEACTYDTGYNPYNAETGLKTPNCVFVD